MALFEVPLSVKFRFEVRVNPDGDDLARFELHFLRFCTMGTELLKRIGKLNKVAYLVIPKANVALL